MQKFLKIALRALLFCLFGLICLFGNLIFLPIILLNLQKFRPVQNFSRFLVRNSWNFFIFSAQILGAINSNHKILKNLGNSGEIIIANHPSLLDIVFFLAQIKRANCIVKSDLGKNLFLFGAIKACGYILNTQNEICLKNACAALKNGESLIIFPEGSRTKEKIIFHKAAAYIAVNSAKNLSAIFIKMHPLSLKKGQKWFESAGKNINYNFKILEKIELANFHPNRPSAVRARNLHSHLNEIYQKEFLC